jgi:hypothetical protein
MFGSAGGVAGASKLGVGGVSAAAWGAGGVSLPGVLTLITLPVSGAGAELSSGGVTFGSGAWVGSCGGMSSHLLITLPVSYHKQDYGHKLRA